MLDDGTGGGHTISFYTDTSATPFMSLAIEEAGTNFFDLTLKAQGNMQTIASAISQGVAYFLYGRLDASADLMTWTFSASVTNDIATIPGTETWQLSQSNFYSTESGYTVDGITYTVELRMDLTSGSWRTGQTRIQEQSVDSNGDGTESVTVRSLSPISEAGQLFMRLKVE